MDWKVQEMAANWINGNRSAVLRFFDAMEGARAAHYALELARHLTTKETASLSAYLAAVTQSLGN